MTRKLSLAGTNFTKPNLLTEAASVEPPASATLSSVFSTGVGQLPSALVASPDGQFLYLSNGSGISRYTIATNTNTAVTPLSPAISGYMAISPDGRFIYAATFTDHRVVALDTQNNYSMTVIAGSGTQGQADGVGTAATFTLPDSCCISADGAFLYVRSSSRIAQINLATGAVTSLVAATGSNSVNGFTLSKMVTDGEFLYATGRRQYFDGTAFQQGGRIYRISLATGECTAISGEGIIPRRDGRLQTARFGQPRGLAIDPQRRLLICTTLESTLRAIDLANEQVITLAGVDGVSATTNGTGSAARLNTAEDIVRIGSDYYLAERGSLSIRRAVINYS